MSTLPSLLFLGLLFSLVSTVPLAPRNVTVRSQNFQHIVTWKPADISSTPLFYRVQHININGDRNAYFPEHCSNTTDLKCDLTDELTDVNGLYSVQVQSISPIGSGSKWARTQFKPLEETILGPPIVHLSACDSCINVTIQPPVSHLKSAGKTRTRSLLDVYHILKYVLTLKGPRGFLNEISEEAAVENFSKIIYNLLPKSNYCLSVIATATSNLNEFGIPSALKCIVTDSSSSYTGAGSTIWTIALGVAAAVVVLILLIVLNAAGLICLRIPTFPNALYRVSKPESAFRENKWNILTEKVCPVEVVFNEKKNKEYDSEETDDSDTEVIFEEYASRPRVCTSSSNVEHSNSGDSKTIADSSLVDMSGHKTLSTAVADSEEHQSVVNDESGASKCMTPLMDVHSSAPLDNSGSFNVNLASVMLGALPMLQEDDAAIEDSSQGDQDSSVSSQDSSAPLLVFDFNLLINKIGVAGPELPAVSDDCFSNEALFTDESESEDSEPTRVSEYMSR